MGAPAVVVFTRDLRIRDNPALLAAADEGPVVPLFVFDDGVLGTWHRAPNRLGFLLESLADLDASLRGLGVPLVVRRGDWVDEVITVARAAGATSVHLADDVSGFACRRRAQLEEQAAPTGIAVEVHAGVTVVPPGDLAVRSTGTVDGEYKVFTPYFRRWSARRWRDVLPAPDALVAADAIDNDIPVGVLPELADLTDGERSPHVIVGGETEGLARLKAWAASGLAAYPDHHDDLAADDTSRMSAFLHFGCLSPLEVATRLRRRPGGDALVRQLCWRDFYCQVLAARPAAATHDYRPHPGRWVDDDDALTAWKAGRTGYPLVDAGMRQLRAEGWMHNRARLVTASFLTKDLGIDWRAGARHFMDLLVDGDVANNQLNWQWVAGTGNDQNRYRVFNPLRQAERFDKAGEYTRRWVPELADLPAKSIADPSPDERRARNYPDPLVDHAEAVTAHRQRSA